MGGNKRKLERRLKTKNRVGVGPHQRQDRSAGEQNQGDGYHVSAVLSQLRRMGHQRSRKWK